MIVADNYLTNLFWCITCKYFSLDKMCALSGGSVMVVADKAVDNTTVSLSWIPSSARLCAVGSDKRGNCHVYLNNAYFF